VSNSQWHDDQARGEAALRQWARERDAMPARVATLEAAIREAVADLTEHAADEDCAGPRGTSRRGACPMCRVAAQLERAVDGGAR
jgi:hypothetical protein